MKKKVYQQPALCIVTVESHAHILSGSDPVQSVSSNLTGDEAVTYGGGNSSAARVKAGSVDWDDWGE